MQRFLDAGEYQHHVALPQGVPAEPVGLVATSSLGGTAVKAPRAWPGATPPSAPAGYQQDFIHLRVPDAGRRAGSRLRRLACQYPNLVDLIDLPNQTNGYRRTATAYVGNPTDAAIVVESRAFGSSGDNGLQVKTVAADRADRPQSATFRDRVLTVTLATGADGGVISTTDRVFAFFAAKYPQRLNAFVEHGSAGKPMPVVASVRLSDGLTASGLSRPWPVKALRIGTHGDGTGPGVLVYSQEHARKWATPLVTMEFAERLLANSTTDPETAKLPDAVDVFVLPVTNPDGANYSFNDYNFQRKNMDTFCTGAARDPKNRNRFGVDVNRNYTVGSVFDGYVGGSLDCLSSGAAGPAELSEAEQSAEFLSAAKRIVGAISGYRGTVTWPSNTGPVADVLFSAGGNSADLLYYEFGSYAWDFEVGNDLWNPTTKQWEGVGFRPPYDEAHAESQEYAAVLVELLQVAKDSATLP